MYILIAEDEEYAWKSYEIALKLRGHQVTITQNGEDCISVYRQRFEQFMISSVYVPLLRQQQPSAMTSNILFDAVVLDYRIPKKNGMQVAKEILAMNPRQRIIFASAYVEDTLIDSIKELKQIVELLQKPFEMKALVDTIEDKEIYEGLKQLNVNVNLLKDMNPNHEQIRDLLDGLRKLLKGRTF
jgi:DNA-binding NtrC family response regulator